MPVGCPPGQAGTGSWASRTRAAPQPRRMCDTAASPWPRPARLDARAQRMPKHGRKRRLRHARAAQAAFFAAPAEGAAGAACTRRKRLPALLAPTAASAAHAAAARSTNPASRRAVSGPRARALLSSRGRAKPAGAAACQVRWGIRNHLWHAKSAPYTCARGARGAAGRREQGGRTQRQLERACQALREQRPRARLCMRRRRGGE